MRMPPAINWETQRLVVMQLNSHSDLWETFHNDRAATFKLLHAPKCAVEIAVEDSEHTALAYLSACDAVANTASSVTEVGRRG